MSKIQDSIADLERRIREREFPTARQGEEARKGETEVNAEYDARIAALLEKHHPAAQAADRIRELEGDLDNARHDLQAVHALQERLRQAEAQRDHWKSEVERLLKSRKEIIRQRDDAWKRIDELEGAVRSARLEIEDAIRERDELRVTAEGERGRAEGYREALREQAAQVAALRDALHAINEGGAQDFFAQMRQQEHIRRLLTDTAAAAQAHDARVRAEGWREGLRQAVTLLRAEADRREPHAEADALRVAAADMCACAIDLQAGKEAE